MSSSNDWAERTEREVLALALPLAPALGWTTALVRRAGAAAGLTEPEAELLLPNGPKDLAALLSRRHDAAMLESLAAFEPASLKIRDRIRVAVEARTRAAAEDGEAVRRCIGFLALPQNLALGARLAWASADAAWRWAGDTATDENHYSKRAILSALMTSTLAVRLAGGEDAARRHLERGIEGVMSFEKAKARFRTGDWAGELAARLGALRYGRGADETAGR